jgi:APA family basic amino acid/polyamine antiporter
MNNQADEKLGTGLIRGELVALEYYESAAVRGLGKLEIGKATHGYKDPFSVFAWGDAASCEMNVNCPQGAGWKNEKRSAVRIIDNGDLCSGAMINNVLQDGKPYMLTANHCFTTTSSTWVYSFNWEAPGCTTPTLAIPETLKNVKNGVLILSDDQFKVLPTNLTGMVEVTRGMINAPALIILLLLTLLLIKGTQESAFVNMIIVFVKVAIVLLFIGFGWQFIKPENHTPYLIPKGTIGHDGFFKWGWGGVLGGAAIVFFAFIGFDAVSTAAQEAKNPKRDMPIGILGSLVVCTILYILFGHVLTGVANYSEFSTAGKEASVAYAIKTYMKGYEWLGSSVTVAILAGFSSVILVMLMGQSRIFFSMSNDGLIPKAFGELHPKYKTPYKANLILFVFVGLFAAFIPGSVAGDLTSFGTLFAFVLVSIGVWILRVKSPDIERPFRAPLVPIVSTLGALVCLGMIVALDLQTLKVAFIWMAIGLVVYFAYSRKNSKLRNK